MKQCTFIADKHGKPLGLGDVVEVKIQNHPSMKPIYNRKKVMAVIEVQGIRFEGSSAIVMFDDKSHPEYEIINPTKR